jgi:hypothetical protein
LGTARTPAQLQAPAACHVTAHDPATGLRSPEHLERRPRGAPGPGPVDEAADCPAVLPRAFPPVLVRAVPRFPVRPTRIPCPCGVPRASRPRVPRAATAVRSRRVLASDCRACRRMCVPACRDDRRLCADKSSRELKWGAEIYPYHDWIGLMHLAFCFFYTCLAFCPNEFPYVMIIPCIAWDCIWERKEAFVYILLYLGMG